MSSLGRAGQRGWMMLSQQSSNLPSQSGLVRGSWSSEAGKFMQQQRTRIHTTVSDVGELGSPLMGSSSFDSDLNVLATDRRQVSASRLSASTSFDEGLGSFVRENQDLSVSILSTEVSTEFDKPSKRRIDDESLQNLKAEVSQCMKAGKLVSEEIMMDLVQSRILDEECVKHGWLLDGFPRNEDQVMMLQECNELPDVVISLSVSDSDVLDRLENRRNDPVTGKIYNLKHRPPADPEVLARLVQREDDTGDTIRARLETFHRDTAPVLEAFQREGVPILDIEAGNASSPEEVFRKVHGEVMHHFISKHFFEGTRSAGPIRIVLMGMPGCGKGTQAENLRKAFGLVHISTGDLLRNLIAEDRS